MGSQVVQLNMNMKGNEGSKIPRLVPKSFISESIVFVETYMHLLSKIEVTRKDNLFSNAMKLHVVHTDYKSIKYIINNGARRKIEGPI